jgi:hypothetical protein
VSDSGNPSGGGVGLCSLLFVLFLALKLLGKITWSWWWVTAPLWIPAAITLTIIVLAMPFIIAKQRR